MFTKLYGVDSSILLAAFDNTFNLIDQIALDVGC